MPQTLYYAQNYAHPTTATPTAVATGTAIKTMLQGTATANLLLEIVMWQFDFDTAPVGNVELIHTTTVAGGSPTAVTPTVWCHPSSGAAASTWGFSPSTEGTVVATTRTLDFKQVAAAGPHVFWFPPGERPQVPKSGVVRVRVDMATGANMTCAVLFAEVGG
jgi:hypothetical protein